METTQQTHATFRGLGELNDALAQKGIQSVIESLAQDINTLYHQLHEPVSLKIKKLYPDVQFPTKANSSDMCFDLYAYSDPIVSSDGFIEYKTGLIFEIPEGYDVQLFCRSSVRKYNLQLTNSVGIVDNSYRGEIIFSFKPNYSCLSISDYSDTLFNSKLTLDTSGHSMIYKKGDKIGQACLVKKSSFYIEEVEDIDLNTERGQKGFGSSGQ